jgi:hypothetical protein
MGIVGPLVPLLLVPEKTLARIFPSDSLSCAGTSFDNPTWGEDKISADLDLKLGIKHSTSTIRKYMVRRPSPGHQQTWRTFLKHEGHEIFACDFMTQHTALFAVIYVFVVMELDGIFGQFGHPRKGSDGKHYRCHLDRWLDEVLIVKGIPTPFHALNANARVERFNRTLREDALNHFIFLGEDPVRRVAREFVAFYNGARPSRATHAIPEPYADLQKPPPKNGRLVALPVLGGIQHDYRLAA